MDWDPAKAAPVLQRAAGQLAILRIQAATEYSALMERYLAAVESFINDTRPDRPAWTSIHQAILLAGVPFRRLPGTEPS